MSGYLADGVSALIFLCVLRPKGRGPGSFAGLLGGGRLWVG